MKRYITVSVLSCLLLCSLLIGIALAHTQQDCNMAKMQANSAKSTADSTSQEAASYKNNAIYWMNQAKEKGINQTLPPFTSWENTCDDADVFYTFGNDRYFSASASMVDGNEEYNNSNWDLAWSCYSSAKYSWDSASNDYFTNASELYSQVASEAYQWCLMH